jgi:hypothetical protein
MREQVVDYYNDEIMDNLVRAVNGQPFVHVDVTSLQAIATTKLAGSAGGGETQTHTTGTNPAITAAGIVSTFSRAVTRPFTFSVSPERDENLTINSVPVIGAVPAVPDVGRSLRTSMNFTCSSSISLPLPKSYATQTRASVT